MSWKPRFGPAAVLACLSGADKACASSMSTPPTRRLISRAIYAASENLSGTSAKRIFLPGCRWAASTSCFRFPEFGAMAARAPATISGVDR